MTYSKQGFQNGDVLTAEQLNHMEDGIGNSMERVVMRLVKNANNTYKLTSLDGADLTFNDVYDLTRNLSAYVVVVYGSSKLRPQYVSTNEMQFIGLDRSTETKVLRIIMTPTTLTYSTYKLAEWADVADKANIDGYYSDMSVGLAENLISPDGVIDEEPYIYRTTAGSQSVTDGVAELRAVRGNTLVWNQLATNELLEKAENGITFTQDGYKIVANGTATESSYVVARRIMLVKGHKYFLNSCPQGGTYTTYRAYLVTNVPTLQDYGDGCIYTAIDDGFTNYVPCYIYKGYTANNLVFNMGLVDLTQLFGAGNEPTDVNDSRIQWLEQMLEQHPDYDAGSMLNVDVNAIKTVGFNQWDEEWELGSINATGDNASDPNRIRSKNYIKVIPNTEYAFTRPLKGSYLAFYDNNKVFIERLVFSNVNTKFITPNNAHYCRFAIGSSSSPMTTYNHDICINLSWSGYRNGEYEPYWSQVKNLPDIKSIKDADGNQVFPYGLLSAGNVRDEITDKGWTRKMGHVDLGSLNFTKDARSEHARFYASMPDAQFLGEIISAKYTNTKTSWAIQGDRTVSFTRVGEGSCYIIICDYEYDGYTASQVKNALLGVLLYYELETPITGTFPEPYNLNYRISDFGTEEFISDTFTAPASHETFYMSNLRDAVRRLPTDYQSNDSMNNLLSALSSAFNVTITPTWHEDTKSYTYAIVPNVSTQEIE